MNMDLSNFKLLKEDNSSYHVGHPNGRKLVVGKQGLSPKAKAAIEKLRGMRQKFDEGGDVAGPATGIAAEAAPRDVANQTSPLIAANKAFEQEKVGVNAGAQAEGQQALAENAAIDKVQGGIDELPTQNDLFQKHQASQAALLQAYQDQKLDPNHYWDSKDTGSKITAGIGLLLSGMGSGTTGQPNLALGVINNAIDRDIEAQKNGQSKALNLYKLNQENYENESAANIATKNQMLTGLKYKVQQASNSFVGPLAKAKALQLTAQIDKEQAANNLKLSLMSPTSDVSPEQKVQFLVPPAQQKDVFTEIKQAQAAKQNGQALLEAFDQAAQDRRLLTGGHPIYAAGLATPPSIKALQNGVLPLIHDSEGRVNEYEAQTAQKLFPGQFDSDESVKANRDAFEQWIKGKAIAPTAKGFGIDLSKYPSTSVKFGASPTDAISKAKALGYSDEQIRNYLNGRK